MANVAVWGEKDPQLQVVVDPDRLRANGITLDTVLQTVRDATAVGAGGFVDTANQRLALRHVPAVYTPEQLGEIVVAYRTHDNSNSRPASTDNGYPCDGRPPVLRCGSRTWRKSRTITRHPSAMRSSTADRVCC